MRWLRLLLTVAALTAVGVVASLLLGQPEPAAADPAGEVIDSGSGEGRCPAHLNVGEYTCTETPTTKPVDMPTHERAPHTTFWQKKKVTTEESCEVIPIVGGEYCTTREVVSWVKAPDRHCWLIREKNKPDPARETCEHTAGPNQRYVTHEKEPGFSVWSDIPNKVPVTTWTHQWVRRGGPHAHCEDGSHPADHPGGVCPSGSGPVCPAGSDHAGEPEANASRCPGPLARWIT